jgi:phage terminase large subunit-like protein
MTPWDPAWKSSDYTNLKRNPKTFLSNSANLAQQRKWGLSIANNSEWTNTLTELLKTHAKDILGNDAPSLKDWTSLATYFNDQNDGGKKWLMALYTWLGGQATSGKAYTEKTITRENFSTLTFHNKTE